jgi:phosphoribosyl-ATP pyrophosphohydrolase/phosphoribosyl-AMP cyclohydrolase
LNGPLTKDDIIHLDFAKDAGLIPCVIQHSQTLQVLMVGYMNAEALRASFDSGYVTFYSRSKQRLWQKGETSGDRLRLVMVTTDCDQDALLVLAIPLGPTCHLKTTSCFGSDTAPGIGFLAHLSNIIADRAKQAPHLSYTARLVDKGIAKIAQKVGEEGLETALAGRCGDLTELHQESADLLYHLSVLLMARQTDLSAVLDVLRQRHHESLVNIPNDL